MAQDIIMCSDAHTLFAHVHMYVAAGRTPLQGAATSLNCAVNPKLNSKKHFFYSDCKPVRPNSDAW